MSGGTGEVILAGVDEVGYGPLLGPLVVGRSAARVPAEADGVPDLWKLLKPAVSVTRDRAGRRLHVADSKKVYSPSKAAVGLRELERTALAFAQVAGTATGDLDALLAAADPAAAAEARQIDWYAPPPGDAEKHPAEADAASVAIAANALRHACDAAGVTVLPPRAAVAFEPRYNRMCDALRNKSAVVQSLAAGLIAELLDADDPTPLLFVCDRQGGRTRYGPFLRQMFAEWELSVESEADARSDYRLTRGGRVARIIFAEKGRVARPADRAGERHREVPARAADGPVQRLVVAARAGPQTDRRLLDRRPTLARRHRRRSEGTRHRRRRDSSLSVVGWASARHPHRE